MCNVSFSTFFLVPKRRGKVAREWRKGSTAACPETLLACRLLASMPLFEIPSSTYLPCTFRHELCVARYTEYGNSRLNASPTNPLCLTLGPNGQPPRIIPSTPLFKVATVAQRRTCMCGPWYYAAVWSKPSPEPFGEDVEVGLSESSSGEAKSSSYGRKQASKTKRKKKKKGKKRYHMPLVSALV